MRAAAVLLAIACTFCAACVTGKTPDCSTPESGCFPGDGGSSGDSGQADGSDASSVVIQDAGGDVGTD